ncbi:MAG: F0F1 ATP synthase subunit B [Nitrospiraceae bacterium]|nr:F0F1 ATP synthase subunit B [Nitrospiraceae bacterium]
MKNKKLLNLVAFSLVMGMTACAYAAEAAPEAGGEWKEWLWKIVNFAILVVILVVFLRKPLSSYLKARTEGIQKSLDEARKAKEIAEQALRDVEERLKLKDKEIESIINSAKASGEGEKAALIKEAERMSEKIREHAQANIEVELKKARDAIKKEAAELAVALAEKKLAAKMTPEEQKKLLEESIAKLEGKS